MKILAITQARTTSSRLPQKVLLKVLDKSLLQIHVERILKSHVISELVIATTVNRADDAIADLAKELGINIYRGSEHDVLDRFYKTCLEHSCDYVVRLTSDCPLIDPSMIDSIITLAIENDLDYCSNTLDPQFPDGQDVEVFKFSVLEDAWYKAKEYTDREHVTPYIWKRSDYKGGSEYKSMNFTCAEGYKYSSVRLTVDQAEDFAVIESLIKAVGFSANWKTYADYYIQNEEIKSLNSKIERNEGYIKNTL